jgi:heme exporter protein CcmD
MDPTPFIVAAYGITIGALGGFVVWAVVRMRRAERALDGEQ